MDSQVPHFTFYKNQQIVHEEEGIDAEQLENDVLYYGDPDAPIHQLRSRADFEEFLRKHKDDDKLVVIDIGLKNCGPCVKVRRLVMLFFLPIISKFINLCK